MSVEKVDRKIERVKKPKREVEEINTARWKEV